MNLFTPFSVQLFSQIMTGSSTFNSLSFVFTNWFSSKLQCEWRSTSHHLLLTSFTLHSSLSSLFLPTLCQMHSLKVNFTSVLFTCQLIALKSRVLHVHTEHISPSFLFKNGSNAVRDLEIKMVDVESYWMEMNGPRVDNPWSLSKLLDSRSSKVILSRTLQII